MRNNKKNSRNAAKKKASFFDTILDMPKEVVTGLPKITILGFNEMVIENYKGILEYEQYYLRIETYIGIVNINGLNFDIKNMSEDDILIKGQVDSIELEQNE